MNDSSSSTPPLRTTGGGWRWEPPEPEELQRMLPQFHIDCLIGRGGMGAVYRGIQTSLERPVAIKLLPPAIEQQDSAFADRFRNEARLMGRLNHPAIVSVYDFGRTTEGQLYFVMEYVDGTDVQGMIAREGRLPPEHALAVTAHVCDALGYAHRQGIVHRDIKPSNVLIDMEGRVKVADFGLAKLTTPHSSMNTGLTQTGMAMGTPDYLAPEALRRDMEVDGRADLYAVGVMLYQMLTGDIPRGVFKMPSQKFQSIDPRFDRIVRCALEQDREERYQTSQELRRDLDIILTTPLAVAGSESSAALPKQAVADAAHPSPGRTVVPSSRSPASPQARQRPEPYFEPAIPPPPSQGSTLPYAIAVVLMLGVGAWFMMNQKPHRDEAPPREGESSPPGGATRPGDTPPPRPTGSPPTPPGQTAGGRPGVPPPPPKITRPAISPPVKDAPGGSVPMVATQPTSPPVTPTVPATLPQGVQDRLASLESQFQSVFEREVNKGFSDLIATLGTGYLAALERTLTEATRGGRLDEAIALRDEKLRFVNHKFMPSIDPPGLHSVITRLRGTYRSAEKAYAQQKDATSLPLYDRYIEVLAGYERDLAAQGKTTEAALVRTKRQDVMTRRAQRAAKVPPGTTPFKTTGTKLNQQGQGRSVAFAGISVAVL